MHVVPCCLLAALGREGQEVGGVTGLLGVLSTCFNVQYFDRLAVRCCEYELACEVRLVSK